MAFDGLSYYERLIIAIDAFVLFLGISSTILRLYGRRVAKMKLWFDDYFMAAGVVSTPIFSYIRGPHHLLC